MHLRVCSVWEAMRLGRQRPKKAHLTWVRKGPGCLLTAKIIPFTLNKKQGYSRMVFPQKYQVQTLEVKANTHAQRKNIARWENNVLVR